MNGRILNPLLRLSIALTLLGATGCAGLHKPAHVAGTSPLAGCMPNELAKVTLPPYVIEPPDILVVDAIHLVPKPPYRIRSTDVLQIQVEGTLPDAPLDGEYVVQPGGTIDLGSIYGGSISVADMTLEEAKAAIETHLKSFLRQPLVSLTPVQIAGLQQVAGEHLVTQDGTISLGTYGAVPVVGMTLEQAQAAIEEHLAQYLDRPEVSVEVFAYNSKVYYVITEGAGLGDSITRFPVTGNETVLDAIANINGLTEVSSKQMWIARPSRVPGKIQILPVDWKAITKQGEPLTNYQIMPGDRIFVAQDERVALDTSLGKITAPIERVMGFSLLGVNALSRFSGRVLINQFGGGGGGF